jgi:ABC-2 type transporter.
MATIFGNGQLENLPIGIVDNSNTAQSREIIRDVRACPTFKFKQFYQDEKQARDALQSFDIYGYLVIPPDFEKDIYTTNGGTLTFYYHYAILAVGGEMKGTFTSVLSQISATPIIKNAAATGLTQMEIKPIVLPISSSFFPIYNPDLDYSIYLSYPYFFVFFQILILVFTVYVITFEKRNNTINEWLKSAGDKKFNAILLKLLPYYIIFCIESIFATYIFFGKMNIPFSCGFIPLIISILFLLASTMSIGVIICALVPNTGIAMSMASMFGALGATICGVTFPIDNMYKIIEWVAYLFPVRYFTHITHNILYSDMSIGYSWNYFIYITIILLFPFVLEKLITKNIFNNRINVHEKLVISPVIILIVIGGTIGYGFLYNIMYKPNIVEKVPITVVDLSQSETSRKYINYLNATQSVEVKAITSNFAEAELMMKNHESRGIIYLPYNFIDKLALSEESTFLMYETTTSFLYYLAIQTGAVGALTNLNNELRNDVISELPLNAKYSLLQTPKINISGIPLYNHNGGYGSFLIPIVLIVILFQTMIMAIGIYMGENKQINIKIVLLFALAYFLLSIFVTGVLPNIFNLPQLGNPITIFSFVLLFIVATAAVGLAFAPLFKSDESIMLAIPFFSVGLIFLSGLSFPVEQMPKFWYYFSYIFPTTPATRGYVKINSLGGDIDSIKADIIALIIQIICYSLLYLISKRYDYKKQFNYIFYYSKIISLQKHVRYDSLRYYLKCTDLV